MGTAGFISCFHYQVCFSIFKLVHTTSGCERPRAVNVNSVKGLITVSQSAHRELAPIDPHQVFHLVRSHLAIMTSIYQYSSSQLDLILELSNFMNCSSSKSTSRAIAREKEHSGRHPQKGCRGMCSDPLDPGGEVRGCSVGCTLGMSDISHFCVTAASNVHREFPELKECICKPVWFGCGGVEAVSQ